VLSSGQEPSRAPPRGRGSRPHTALPRGLDFRPRCAPPRNHGIRPPFRAPRVISGSGSYPCRAPPRDRGVVPVRAARACAERPLEAVEPARGAAAAKARAERHLGAVEQCRCAAASQAPAERHLGAMSAARPSAWSGVLPPLRTPLGSWGPVGLGKAFRAEHHLGAVEPARCSVAARGRAERRHLGAEVPCPVPGGGHPRRAPPRGRGAISMRDSGPGPAPSTTLGLSCPPRVRWRQGLVPSTTLEPMEPVRCAAAARALPNITLGSWCRQITAAKHSSG